jgi:toxin ParE1/3/4
VNIRLTDSALDDLVEIRRHYLQEGVPDVGERIVSELLRHIDRLADYPDIGRIVPEFETANLRELIHPPFRVVYWREADRMSVIRVWRSERLLRLPGE